MSEHRFLGNPEGSLRGECVWCGATAADEIHSPVKALRRLAEHGLVPAPPSPGEKPA